MGYIKHNAIIVTGWEKTSMEAVHSKAKEIFKEGFKQDNTNGDQLISELILGLANTQYTFMVAPDGSKEGWATSNFGDEAREELLNWISKSNYYCDYIEIRFGGDDELEGVIRSNEIDYDY